MEKNINSMSINKDIAGEKVKLEKLKSSIIGGQEVIAYRGTIITFSSIAVLASSVKLIKDVPELSYRMGNQGVIQNILTVLGIGACVVIIPAAVALIKRQLVRLKEDIRMLKYEKQWMMDSQERLQQYEN